MKPTTIRPQKPHEDIEDAAAHFQRGAELLLRHGLQDLGNQGRSLAWRVAEIRSRMAPGGRAA